MGLVLAPDRLVSKAHNLLRVIRNVRVGTDGVQKILRNAAWRMFSSGKDNRLSTLGMDFFRYVMNKGEDEIDARVSDIFKPHLDQDYIPQVELSVVGALCFLRNQHESASK